MKTTISAALGAGLILATAAPVLAQSVGERTGVNSALGISPTTQDFITQAAISDLFEIESSRLAVERATDAPTKTFAQQMITDHTKTTSELKGLLTTANLQVTPPAALDAAHQKKLDRLKGLNGADFTKAYHEMQEDAHEAAVSLFKRYASGGDVPALKDWAGRTLPALQHHLKMADELNK